jgi:hypothetical protein
VRDLSTLASGPVQIGPPAQPGLHDGNPPAGLTLAEVREGKGIRPRLPEWRKLTFSYFCSLHLADFAAPISSADC